KNQKDAAWLTHAAGGLKAAEQLTGRKNLSAKLESVDRAYLAACRTAEAAATSRTRRMQAVVGGLLVAVGAGLAGWYNQAYLAKRLEEPINWFIALRPYVLDILVNLRPKGLTTDAEHALKPGESFRECSAYCPEMIVVPAGAFMMGSETEIV